MRWNYRINITIQLNYFVLHFVLFFNWCVVCCIIPIHQIIRTYRSLSFDLSIGHAITINIVWFLIKKSRAIKKQKNYLFEFCVTLLLAMSFVLSLSHDLSFSNICNCFFNKKNWVLLSYFIMQKKNYFPCENRTYRYRKQIFMAITGSRFRAKSPVQQPPDIESGCTVAITACKVTRPAVTRYRKRIFN
jgi:CDP-diglyceride synthetase